MRTLEDMLGGMDLAEFITMCRLDFKFFSEQAVHEIKGEKIQIKPFHLEWINMFLKNKRSVIIASRGLGKSTVLGVLFPLWISFFDRNKHFLVVSNAMHQSTDIMDTIRAAIEDNELLQKLKPEKTETWTRTEISMSTKCKITAKPYNENIRGGHYDYILCDEASLYQDPSIFYSAVIPTSNARKGNIMVIGTPISQGDLLMSLSENHEYKVKIYPILVNNESIWPERFSHDDIERIKSEMRSADFAREYLCQITDDTVSPFPMSLIVSCYDPKRRIEDSATDGTYYVGADFALAAKGDWSAFVIVKNTQDGIVLSNIYRYRGLPFHSQVSILKDINAKFHPVKFLVDKSSFGELFLDELMQANLPVSGFSFTQENRNSLINTSIKKMQEGKIILPYDRNHSETQYVVDILSKELSSFAVDKTRTGMTTYVSRAKHDDTAVAFFLAVKASSEEKPFLSYFRSGTWDDLKIPASTETSEKIFTIETR